MSKLKLAKEAGVRGYKVKISGSFKTFDGDVEDYSDVTGIVPFQAPEIAEGLIRKRYAKIWVAEKTKSKIVKFVRECYIDDMEEVNDANFSFLGKSIDQMNQLELQDLATAYNLTEIPLYKRGSERHARGIAYSVYFDKVLDGDVSKLNADIEEVFNESTRASDGYFIIERDGSRTKLITDYKVSGFNLTKAPKIVVDSMPDNGPKRFRVSQKKDVVSDSLAL